MARTRFRRVAATLVVGALASGIGIPLVTTAPTAEEQAALPGVSVCVFYGVCTGPSLPERP